MICTTEILRNNLNNYSNKDNKISRMTSDGTIHRVTKNLYETDMDTPSFLLANCICSPSYISFDYALSFYNLIPEAVYTVTSATFGERKKKLYKTDFGSFSYRDVPQNVFPYGVDMITAGDYSYCIATPEKALCDKLYTISPTKNMRELEFLLFDDLRIDEDEFVNLNKDDISFLSEIYHCTNVTRMNNLLGKML